MIGIIFRYKANITVSALTEFLNLLLNRQVS